MTHIIVKDRRVAVQGGRVVTSAGGAPCCCGGSVNNCGLLASGSCWQLTITGVVPNPNLHDLSNVSNGLPQNFTECGAFQLPGTAARNIVKISGFNRTVRDRFFGSNVIGEVVDGISKVGFPYDPPDPPSFFYGERYEYRANVRCGSFLNTQGLWPGISFSEDTLYVVDVLAAINGFTTTARNPYTALTLFYFNSFEFPDLCVPVPVGQEVPNLSLCIENGPGFRAQKGGLGGTATVSFVSNSGTECSFPDQYAIAARCDGSGGTISVDLATNPGDLINCYFGGNLYFLTNETTTDDPVAVEWTADECDEPVEWPEAILCDGSARITYDPALRPVDGVTLLVGSDRYIPVASTSTDSPTGGAWTTDPCEDPSDAIYRINRCNSTLPATWFEIVAGLPQSRTVGYRPGNGLVPGQGHVRTTSLGQNGCLLSVASQPTTVEWDTEPEVILTSIPGGCQGRPTTSIDPRPQCQPVDGGGGTGPIQSPAIMTDEPDIPQLGNIIEQVLRTVSFSTLVSCGACERRKEVLNRYGEKIGRAVIRRLGW